MHILLFITAEECAAQYGEDKSWAGRLDAHWVGKASRQLYSCHYLDQNTVLFTPKSVQFQISPAASPEILHHTVWGTWVLKWLTQMEDDHITTGNELTRSYISLEKVRRMYFLSLGVKRKRQCNNNNNNNSSLPPHRSPEQQSILQLFEARDQKH